jgi:putative DNA primase/helicase
MSKVASFRQQMADHNLDPGEIIPDGAVHRFPTWGDSADEVSGAYWHNGNVGWFQDWRTMEKPEVVKGKLTKADQAALNSSFSGTNNKVSRKALETGIRRIWNAGTEPDGHPYLIRKGITAPVEVKQHDGCLVIPVFGVDGELNGLQRIDANGRKRFLAGTRKKGSFFSISGNGTHIACEGLATGVSLHMATGASIVVAFDAGNLVQVAKAVSKKVSSENIIIAGDNDAWKLQEGQPNIGTDTAKKAAQEIGARIMVPEFKSPDGKKTTDFNDLHLIEGLDAVKAQFEAAGERTGLQGDDLRSRLDALAEMDPVDREIERNRISKDFNVRLSFIDKWISDIEKEEKAGGATDIVVEVEPAENPVDGAGLLSAIKMELLKYVILPGGVAESIAAWIVLTYCPDAFRILPLLGIVSPVKRCGKTTLLEILQGLTNKGLTASNISPAAVFRTIEKYLPTLLVDEADTFLKDSDELRGVLNSGHTRSGAYVIRVEGENHEPVKFSTWGPKAVAMIGTLPDTLQDRSVVVSLRRKAPGETVSRIDVDFTIECNELRQACRRWADDNMVNLREIKPNIPTTNNDRLTDNWMPLLAIADVAGGDWPELMRKSMLGMFDGTDDSIGPKLLYDIQDIFRSHPVERIFSDDLVEALKDKKESPWCDWNRGKGLTQNGLARQLKPFDIYSKTMRIGENRRKGYELSSFNDAFKRYIPSMPPISTVTTRQFNNINNIDENQTVTVKKDVTDERQLKLLESFNCHNVTDEKGKAGENKEKETISSVTKRDKFSKESKKISVEI